MILSLFLTPLSTSKRSASSRRLFLTKNARYAHALEPSQPLLAFQNLRAGALRELNWTGLRSDFWREVENLSRPEMAR